MAVRDAEYSINVDIAGILGIAPQPRQAGPMGVTSPAPATMGTASAVAAARDPGKPIPQATGIKLPAPIDLDRMSKSQSDAQQMREYKAARASEKLARFNGGNYWPGADSGSPPTQTLKASTGRASGMKALAGLPGSGGGAGRALGIGRAALGVLGGASPLTLANAVWRNPVSRGALVGAALPRLMVGAATTVGETINQIREEGLAATSAERLGSAANVLLMQDAIYGFAEVALKAQGRAVPDESTLEGREWRRKYNAKYWFMPSLADKEEKEIRQAKAAEDREKLFVETVAKEEAIVNGIEARSLDDAFGTQFMLQMRGNVSRDEAGIRSQLLGHGVRIAAADARRQIIERAREKALKEFPVE